MAKKWYTSYYLNRNTHLGVNFGADFVRTPNPKGASNESVGFGKTGPRRGISIRRRVRSHVPRYYSVRAERRLALSGSSVSDTAYSIQQYTAVL